jgi:predicted amidohydrolase
MTATAIAVAQFAPGADTAENLAAMRALATTASARGAALVVFPEYSSYFTAQMGPDWVDAAQAIDGDFASAISALAAELGIHIVAGMVERTDDPNRVSNTLVAFDEAGVLVARYRKIHLYDAFGQKESDWVVAGEITEPETFRLGALTVGMQTCYDVRFPEVTRRLADAGVDLVLLPSEWVRGPLKEHHWRTLITARAIENTVYFAAPDHAPPVGAGNSMIVDPMGVELATIGESTDIALAWIDTDRIASVRTTNPALSLRRFTVSSKS